METLGPPGSLGFHRVGSQSCLFEGGVLDAIVGPRHQVLLLLAQLGQVWCKPAANHHQQATLARASATAVLDLSLDVC